MVDLQELKLKICYTQGKPNESPIDEFLIPCLENSTEFNVVTGFFSSALFKKIFKGLESFLNNDGKIKILTGWIYNKDLNVLKLNDVELRTLFLTHFSQIIKDFELLKNQNYIDVFVWMILNQKIEIRFAIPLDDKGTMNLFIKKNAIMHEKLGYFKDNKENIISFSGSANATIPAWFYNREQIKVFNNWDKIIKDYCNIDVKKFNEYWYKNDPFLLVGEISELPDEILQKLNKRNKKFEDLDFSEDDEGADDKTEKQQPSSANSFEKDGWLYWKDALIPIIATIQLRDCQKDAIVYLENQEPYFQGILSMATGTGKTIAAIFAIYTLSKKVENLLVVILAPKKYLIEQWYNELKDVISESNLIRVNSDYRDSRKISYNQARTIALKSRKIAIIIGTNESLDSIFFQEIKKQGIKDEQFLLISDECHSIGAYVTRQNLSKITAKYRIGLSATPLRQFDEEGTDFIEDFFHDKKYFNYSIPDGQRDGILMGFNYYAFFAPISEEDLDRYRKLTRDMGRSGESIEDSEKAKRLAIARAAILKKNKDKIPICQIILDKLIQENKLKKLVIYCFDKTDDIEEGKFSQETLLIEYAIRPIYNKYKNFTFMLFDGSKSPKEREEIIKKFGKRDDLILIAIKCLDEGVDIPSLERAIFLSSSGSTREHVQRAGRLFRKNPEKSHKIEFVEIYDILSLPSREQYERNANICEKIILSETERSNYFLESALNQKSITDQITNEINEIKSGSILL